MAPRCGPEVGRSSDRPTFASTVCALVHLLYEDHREVVFTALPYRDGEGLTGGCEESRAGSFRDRVTEMLRLGRHQPVSLAPVV